MLLCTHLSLFSAVAADFMLFAFIQWTVSPEIVDLGFFTLRWYSLLFTTGILLSYYIVRKQFEQAKLPNEVFESLVMHVLVGMIVGMRLGHFLFYEPDAFLDRPLEIFLPVSFTPELRFTGYAGLASHGGAIGILISLWLFYRKYPKVSVWFVLDQLALVAPLVGAFIRLGNFFNSEMIGHPTSMPWAFVFPLVDQLPRHPAQLYEVASYLFIFAGLIAWKSRTRNRPAGLIFSGLLINLFSARFVIEFFKINQVAFESNFVLNMGQLLSLPFIAIGIILYYSRRTKSIAIS
ncbi:prolipoprotein diacylglyceryl transferase [Tunicatimonas pelagia]|uniref:prolipoprotein diacylglyceryl transferase n=1 Tax=Tunicatimonas pelagia TaxID=931531 RepID=UPI002666460F|nr:prolipoprotein diacylglyceryl transferase [Tunicatimonas pelagia]WKN41517.1 prolipoprotein diacylglyceryl transferase [Tunicatimonas pelagia]